MKTKLERLEQGMWPELPFPLTYKDILPTQSKQELTEIRTNLKISNVSRLNKQELAERLSTEIVNHIGETTCCWDHERIKLIHKIAKNNGLWESPLLEGQQYAYYKQRGLLYKAMLDGKHVGIMPSELVTPFKDGMLFPHADRNTDWIKLTSGLLFYYGTLSIQELVQMLEEHSEHRPDPSILYDVLADASDYYEDLFTWDNDFISDSRIEDPALIRKERALRNDLEYRPFTRQQLLKAGERHYVEKDSAFTNVVKYVLERYEIDREEAELMVELCVDAAKAGSSLGDVLNVAEDFVEMPTIESISSLTNLIVALMNGTKQYALKGHSPDELSAKRTGAHMVMNTPPIRQQSAEVFDFASKKKVGRNEPCPCGSGKKYKKCCSE